MSYENMQRACILTENRMLFQKIRLELIEICTTDIFCEAAPDGYDIYFTDLDTYKYPSRGITMSASENSDAKIALPFSIGEIKALALASQREGLTINQEERCARLNGRIFPLTEVEFALLFALYRRRGKFASREELLREVWGDACDRGIINVYIHYIREKLERNGERIILSSRNFGYKIDEKYFSEDIYANLT